MANRFDPREFKKLFLECSEISSKYKLEGQTWSDKGNFGALYRCRLRRESIHIPTNLADVEFVDLSQMELLALAKKHHVNPNQSRANIIANMQDLNITVGKGPKISKTVGDGNASPGRNRSGSIVSVVSRASDKDDPSIYESHPISVVKIIPFDVSSSAIDGNNWMTAKEACEEEQKLSRISLLCSSSNTNLLQTVKIRERYVFK